MTILKKILVSLVVCGMAIAVVPLNDVHAADTRKKNDNLQTAEYITLGKTYKDSVGGLNSGDDYDYYTFTLTQTTTIRYNVKKSASAALYTYLYSASNNSLGYESVTQYVDYDKATDTSETTYARLPAGKYYLRVYTYDNTPVNYTFYVQKWTPEAQQITNVKSQTIEYENPKYTALYLYPRAASYDFSYKSSNTKVLTVNANGYVKTKAYGKATITITAKKPTSGYKNLKYKASTKKITITVKPTNVSNARLANYTTSKGKTKLLKKQLKVTWKRDKLATGYQVEIAKNKGFTSGKKSVLIKTNKTTSKTFTKLKKGSKYYMRMRAYKTINGKKVYGPWVKTPGTVKVY